MRTFPLAFAALLLAPPSPAAAQVSVERVVTGLSAPMYVAAPPGDPRLFIVERGGTIRIWDGEQLREPAFLDISGKVNDNGEGGLLGLAFAPDYATSRAFYVYYTADGDNGPLESRVSRFRAEAAEPDLANPNEKVLLRVDQPADNHNGGTIAFDPDGYLYLGLGDGGGGGDPNDNAQDGTTLLGKMLRLDVAFTSFGDEYAIPGDNPFAADDDGVLDEIWALGLRNPFRFSFDRLDGDLYIGDVGQGAQEEIDVVTLPAPAGGYNFGWDVMEGTLCFDDEGQDPDPGEPPCNDPSLTLPVHTYDRLPGSNSVTGGVVYRGSLPELQGHYFFGDYGQGRIWSFVWDGAGGITDFVDRTAELTPDAGTIGAPVAFGEDAAGEMYIVDLDGDVFRVAPEPGGPLLLAAGAGLLAARRRARG